MSDCKSCNIEDTNPINSTGNCVNDGTPATTPVAGGSTCVETVNGVICPSRDECYPWDLTQSSDECLMSDYIEEQLNIAGTNLFVHKLLGIHEQGLLQDVIGYGEAISSGSLANNPASYAFDKYITEWRSSATGADVKFSAYLGYDFGPIKLENGRTRYGLTTEIMKDISMIKIMQGCEPQNRATKIRIERSENGVKWYGVALVALEDCDGLLTIPFKRSVPSRYWRIRPVEFNGGSSDTWNVRVLQFMEYEVTKLSNIQDKILMENRDRDYQEEAIKIRASYTPQEMPTQFTQAGFNPFSDMYMFDVGFNSTVRSLGRPFVIGDIIMVESERQYSASMRPIDKYLEVTDVFWAANGFTPSWKPTIQKIVAKPLLASQETRDIMGKLTVDVDQNNVFDLNDGNEGKKYQDYMDISDSIRSKHKKDVPVKGIDAADVPILSQELRDYARDHEYMDVDKLSRRRLPNGIDAMPPNGLPYTEGDTFPNNPANGAYHRLSYTALGPNIPIRLHRYSAAKGRWIYLETDRKVEINSHRPLLKQYIGENSTETPLTDIMSEVSKKS